MWFEDLTGFVETTGEEVRQKLVLDGEYLTSTVNGRTTRCGRLTTPSVDELRATYKPGTSRSTLREVVADVQALHQAPENEGALFQVASQFNLLEMVSPSVTPEQGVTGYQNDRTQGPACAIAAGAGTIYRNWFVPLEGQMGQSADTQIDCLADIGAELNNANERLWQMSNGYCLATEAGLDEIAGRLANNTDRDRLMSFLRIGVHENTDVTISDASHTVTQAYCSAMPVAYSAQSTKEWEAFARLILDGAYEATLLFAAMQATKSGSNKVYLTLLGGGVFGNPIGWILDAIERAVRIVEHAGLDIAIVSYGSSHADVAKLVERDAARY